MNQPVTINHRLKVIEHRGVRIMTGDFSGLLVAARVSLFGELADQVIAERVRLIRVNARGTVTTDAAKQAAKSGMLKMEKAVGSVLMSFIGLTEIQRFIANIVVPGHFAASEEEANDWLAVQGAKLK